jgi:hypothetical protein
MPRYLKINIICILFLIFTVPVSSELYQYKDENGIMRLTDDIYSVPTKDRLQLETFSEFEGPSEVLEILPIQNESLAQTKKQTKSKKQTKPKKQTKIKKVIVPKTAKTISATAEKKIISPDIPPDAEKKTASKSKKQTTSPFQAIIPEKVIQAPDTKISGRDIHKSKKIAIKRMDRKVSVQKTALLTPSKSLKKIAKPTAIPKTVAEPKIVNKDKTPKTATLKPDAKTKTGLKIKTKKQKTTLPEKTAKIKAIQKTTRLTVAKKEIKTTAAIADQITSPASKTAKKETKKDITKIVKPDIQGKTIPETKIVKKKQTAPPSDQPPVTKKIAQSKKRIANKKIAAIPKTAPLKPDAKKKTVPKIKTKKQAATFPEKTAAKKEIKATAAIAEQISPPASKTTKKETKKNITKIVKPDIKGKTIPETKIIKKKQTARKSKSNTEIQKAIKSKNVTTDQKTVTPAKTTQAGLKKAIPKKTTTKAVAPQKTVKAAPVIEASKNIPDIRKKTVPVIEKVITDNHDTAVAKKDVTPLIITQKKDESLILAQLQTTRKLLAEKKESLNKKFQTLIKEKQEIENSVDEDDEKSVIKYNENVKKLNIKIKQYKKHKKILQAKIEKYNDTIKQSALN